MKVEIVSYVHGGLAIELVAENDVEAVLLEHSWRLMDGGSRPRRGNGRTVTDKGSTGFYLPLSPDQKEAAP